MVAEILYLLFSNRKEYLLGLMLFVLTTVSKFKVHSVFSNSSEIWSWILTQNGFE